MDSTTVLDTIVYPERDGKPMGETDVHVNELADLLKMLQHRYRDDANAFVGANMLCYYEQGVPSSCFCPDVFVVFGVPKGSRRTFKFWDEKQPPTVIFEVTSRQSRLEDMGNKKYLYASLGVSEYFIYDPLHEYMHPPFQGFVLRGEQYQALEQDAQGGLQSQRLGLRMMLEEDSLALWDSSSGVRLLRPLEEMDRRREAEAELQSERTSRLAAEAELARLKQQIKKSIGE